MAITNPTYDDTLVDDFGECSQLLGHLSESLNELELEDEDKELTASSLQLSKTTHDGKVLTWRKGPAPVDQRDGIVTTKLASLQGIHEMGSDPAALHASGNISSNQQNNRTASVALLNYFAFLGTTNEKSRADYAYMENLLLSADINHIDVFGQSIMHEVAREWHTDLAYFLKVKGADVDKADNFGRTPLFVAVASNNLQMTEWLIKNGANIKHRTMKGQEQTALHFAAKFDALEVFIALMKHGAHPFVLDAKRRTPFFLAAEYGLNRMCTYMLKIGLPTCSYNDCGICCIDFILDKLPYDSSVIALNQYIATDQVLAKEKYYINCLGKRRWRLLNSAKNEDEYKIHPTDPPVPLDIIVENKDLELITHPVILELIALKREKYGLKYNVANIAMYLLFTIVWTIAISLRGFERKKTPVLVFTVLGQLLTILFIIKLSKEYSANVQYFKAKKQSILEGVKENKKYCHPRWEVEGNMLKEISDNAEMLSATFWRDGWNFVEGLCLLMATVQTILTVTLAIVNPSHATFKIRSYYSAIFVVVVWIRLNRSLRLVQSVGPFIAMLGECVIATARFAFLFFEFFIPFSVSFWITFGGVRKGSAGGEYETFNDMLYQLYLLTIVGDYDYDTLKAVDKIPSQIFVGLYVILVSVISLNLFIALLSEAVARVNQTALATTFLKEAEELVTLERVFPYLRKEFDIYANKYYAPELKDISRISTSEMYNSKKMIFDMSRSMQCLKDDLCTIMDTHVELKGNMEEEELAIKNFRQLYSEEKIEEINSLFDNVFDFQTTKLNKIHRVTRNTFNRFVKKQFLDSLSDENSS